MGKATAAPKPQWSRPDRAAGASNNASPICFRCGRRGHLSANCTNQPNAKRSKPSDSASVVFDMSPWANEFAEWRRGMEPGLASGSQDTGDINGLEETRGCAVLDSGATVMCSSTVAAEAIQQQRMNHSEPGEPTVSESDRRFKFVDGRVDEAGKVVEQPVTSGLLAGKPCPCTSSIKRATTPVHS